MVPLTSATIKGEKKIDHSRNQESLKLLLTSSTVVKREREREGDRECYTFNNLNSSVAYMS